MIWLVGATVSSPAQNPAYVYPEADPNGERFLFIVDMSSDMEDLQPAVENAIYELIGGGIFGQMRTGDTFGIWTFNDEPYTGRFTMKVWDQKRAIQQGTVAAAFLSGQNYEKSSDLKEVIKQVKSVVHSVSNVNVLIISDGRSSLSGTPLDKVVNADYKARKSDRRRAKKPFITSLVAREGWFVSHQVAIAGELLRLPERRQPPAPPKPAKPETQVSQSLPPIATAQAPVVVTSAPAPKKMVIVTKTNTPPPVVVSPPAPATNAAVVATPAPSNSSPAVVATALTETNSSTLPAAPIDPVVTSQASILAAIREGSRSASASNTTSAPPVDASSTPPGSSTKGSVLASQPAATPVSSSLIDSVLSKVQPEPVRVAARESETTTERPVTGPVPPLAQMVPVVGLSSSWWMVLGGVLGGGTVLLALSVLRRGRTHSGGTSLITRSMERR